jgi:hypothetical protein
VSNATQLATQDCRDYVRDFTCRMFFAPCATAQNLRPKPICYPDCRRLESCLISPLCKTLASRVVSCELETAVSKNMTICGEVVKIPVRAPDFQGSLACPTFSPVFGHPCAGGDGYIRMLGSKVDVTFHASRFLIMSQLRVFENFSFAIALKFRLDLREHR